jgi:hypothetical protein
VQYSVSWICSISYSYLIMHLQCCTELFQYLNTWSFFSTSDIFSTLVWPQLFRQTHTHTHTHKTVAFLKLELNTWTFAHKLSYVFGLVIMLLSLFCSVIIIVAITGIFLNHPRRTLVLLGCHHRQLRPPLKQAHLHMLLLLLQLLLLQLQMLNLCPVFLAHKWSFSNWMCK